LIDGRPSRTAESVALRRAAHQLLDAPRVHDDPLALAILGEAQAAALRADPRRFEEGPHAPFLRAFLAVRSRLAEDALAQAVARGVRRYVVLGAGLDTFACRNPHPGLRVVEVDHPATQAWKRRRLAEAGIALPASVELVALDFAREPLAPALRAAGLREDEPSFFSWLGVTPYLEPAAVRATLAAIAPFTAGGGGIVFDYSVAPESLAPRSRAALEALAARVAAAGEPFRSFFDPGRLAGELRAMGYREAHDTAPEELNARYFAHRSDGLRVGGAGRIMTALG
jgi:methyltransferase (TIGR00027 family)